MANYAKNLIGNWEFEQYEPLREVALSQYQNNWNKLTNEFNNLKDKLARNQRLAQTQYANTLSDIQDNSYARTKSAYEDLALRGLANSGQVNKIIDLNTETTGQETNQALSDLLSVSSEGVSTLADANSNLVSKQSELNSDLADTLAGIGNNEAQNRQQYAGLVADINESAAQRASSSYISRLSQEDEESELKRRLMINDVLEGNGEEGKEYTDDDKVFYLTLLDVPVEQARQAVSAYNNNTRYEEIQPEIESTKKNLESSLRKSNKLLAIPNPVGHIVRFVNNNKIKKNTEKYTSLNNELNNITLEDLYKILYGDEPYRFK